MSNNKQTLSFGRDTLSIVMTEPADRDIHAYAIIVAGGSGSRMGTAIPKQFLLLHDKPVLFYTLEAFHTAAKHPEILLVLHQEFHSYWHQLCTEYHFNIPHRIIAGGETRFHSVKNAVDIIDKSNAVVAIHDAVRPLVDKNIIDASYNKAIENGNAVVAVQSRDSIRIQKNNTTTALDRTNVYLVQTPQTFTSAQLKTAYEQPYTTFFTDDASVVEQAGFNINIIQGSYSNIKITFPDDIITAEALLTKKAID